MVVVAVVVVVVVAVLVVVLVVVVAERISVREDGASASRKEDLQGAGFASINQTCFNCSPFELD